MSCDVCGQPANMIAAIPMCGARRRYPLCMDCFVPIFEAGYADDVETLTDPDARTH